MRGGGLMELVEGLGWGKGMVGWYGLRKEYIDANSYFEATIPLVKLFRSLHQVT